MAQTPIGPGTILAGRFVLEDLLDESQGARFYRATDRVLARDVAVHVVASDDPRAEALLSAARTSATVSDPHLLRVLDASTEDGVSYVVNEWGTGVSLDNLLAEGPLSARRAAWVAKEAAEAIAAAHRLGIAHGRLIPENVVISDSGSVKLIGFVVDAVIRGREKVPVTGGAALGEHEADVVNLGALLYAGLVARWPGTDGSQLPAAPTEHGRTLRPRQVRAGVPRPLDAICERVLNRDDRHQVMPIESAHEIYAALSDYIGDPTAAVPLGLQPDVSWGAANAAEPTRASSPDTVQDTSGAPLGGRTDPPRDGEATQAGTPVFYDADTGVGWMHDPAARGVRSTEGVAGGTSGASGAGEATEVSGPPSPPPPPFPEPAERPLFASGSARRPQPLGWAEGFGSDASGRASSLAAPLAPGGARSGAALPPTWGPDADAPADDTGEIEAGSWDAERPGRSWMRLAVVIAALLLLVVATIFAKNMGQAPTTDRPPTGSPSPEEPSGSPDTPPRPVQIAEVGDFDPLADPPEENPDLAPLAIDGDPETAWRTVTYFAPLDQVKAAPAERQHPAGVGLLVDLGEPTEVSEVALTLVGETTAVEILAAQNGDGPPAALDELTRVAADREAGTRVSLELDDPTTTQFLVVWLTSLPAIEGGFQGQVAEIVVRS
ncbi:MAG: protein kinase [Nocardioidaceae bacterium]|nr:protein kinase [Nocardioidaceae bacterium]